MIEIIALSKPPDGSAFKAPARPACGVRQMSVAVVAGLHPDAKPSLHQYGIFDLIAMGAQF
jgi:hypothetical protein